MNKMRKVVVVVIEKDKVFELLDIATDGKAWVQNLCFVGTEVNEL